MYLNIWMALPPAAAALAVMGDAVVEQKKDYSLHTRRAR